MVKAAVAVVAAAAAAAKVPESGFRRNSGIITCSHAQVDVDDRLHDSV